MVLWYWPRRSTFRARDGGTSQRDLLMNKMISTIARMATTMMAIVVDDISTPSGAQGRLRP